LCQGKGPMVPVEMLENGYKMLFILFFTKKNDVCS
jgi:hypothetical protein